MLAMPTCPSPVLRLCHVPVLPDMIARDMIVTFAGRSRPQVVAYIEYMQTVSRSSHALRLQYADSYQ